jgi:hypothetical protein
MTNKKTLTLDQLRSIISEEVQKRLLEVGEKEEKEDGEDSLDAQVDRYLADYEKQSKDSKNEGLDFRTMTRRFLLEAEGDEEETSDEESPDEEAKKLTEDDINVENFLDSVMRLIDNYDALLEVRNTILRRAVNFLIKEYEPSVSKTFKENLLDIYGMEIGKSKEESEEYEAPVADRAGPGLGG